MHRLTLGRDDFNYLMFTVNQSLHRKLENCRICPSEDATSSAEKCHSWVTPILLDRLYLHHHPCPVPRPHSQCYDLAPHILFPNKPVNKAFESWFFPR